MLVWFKATDRKGEETMRRKAITVAVLGVVVMLTLASVTVGQPQGRGGQRGGQRGGMFEQLDLPRTQAKRTRDDARE